MQTMDEFLAEMAEMLDDSLRRTQNDWGTATVISATSDPGVPGQPLIEVTGETTQDAALRFRGQRVTLLNFASGVMPGGGVRYGATAQEENLCVCSGLLHGLEQNLDFYEKNRGIHAPSECYDEMIWTEGVPMVRNGAFEVVEPMPLNVITYPAPVASKRVYESAGQFGEVPHQENTLRAIFERRTQHVVHQAAQAGTEVLILGAWGCGAYGNDPKMVAEAFRRALATHSGSIERVVFAVYGRPVENFSTFEQTFRDKMLESGTWD